MKLIYLLSLRHFETVLVAELHLRVEDIQGIGFDIVQLGHSLGTGLKQYKFKFLIFNAPD